MIDSMAAALQSLGPLRIDDVDYSDPSLTLAGEGWSLALVCPWTVMQEDSPLFAWDDSGVGDAVWDLIGRSITGVRRRSKHSPEDPVFFLTGGLAIEVRADTDLDPWSLRLPGHVFVGSKSHSGENRS
jgi:hypothetical protein